MHKTIRGVNTLAANAFIHSDSATMNVDSIQYHHESVPTPERLDANRGDRIDVGIRIKPAKDSALPESMRKDRLTTSASASAAPATIKASKISIELQQQKPRDTTKRRSKDAQDPSKNSTDRHEDNPQRSPQNKYNDVPIEVIEKPSSGTDPNALKRPVRPKTGLETDFFLQPTTLSRLILNQKYGRAIKRVFHHAEETSTWLCAKHKTSANEAAKHLGESSSPSPDTSTTNSIRQLPIHLACGNLSLTQDTSTKSLLNELISVLVFAFPDGAHTPDHRNIYPIQEAIWYGATPETVAIFFMAKPESLHIIDHHGRSLSEINQYRHGTGKEAIQQMIERGVRFWKVARDEAALRLQHNSNLYPSENRSIGSESVLASPDAEEETILTMQESVAAPSYYEEHATPLAWDQLEQRAKATEQILSSVNEENFRLRQQIESLTNKTSHTHTELKKELKRLDRENAVLNKKLFQLEQLIRDKCLTDDEDKNEQFRLAISEVSSLVGISEPSSLFSGFRASDSKAQNDTETSSQQLYDEAILVQKQLAKKHNEQREKIRKLRHMVSYTIINDATMGNDNDIDKESNSSFADVSTVSALSLETARSDASHIIHKKRFHYNEGVVDRLPTETHVLDDLSKIIWYASSRQAVAAEKHGTRVRVQDDLSGILRWAAKKDQRDLFYSNQETPSVRSTWSPIDPREIWRSIPRKQGLNMKSKNRIPPPTTMATTTPAKMHSSKTNSPNAAVGVAAYTGKSATTATNTTNTPKSPPKHIESFDSVHV